MLTGEASGARSLHHLAASVFLDIQMPDMDGYETATAMHALPQCAELPIVAWTGWDGPGSREAMAHARMLSRLTKPVALEELLAMLSRFGSRDSPR
jgi:CheY-like chemotaxis protein